MSSDQDDRYVSRRVDASDVLVQRLNGAVAVVVGDGENEDVSIGPID